MEKGFTYIITTMILIMLITGIILINKPNKQPIVQTPYFLVKNYEIEFNYLNQGSVDENIINTFNLNFLNYINSYNYSAEFCNIIDTKNHIYFSNFTGTDCNLMIGEDVNQTVSNQSTIKIDRFINDMNIYLCSCNYLRENSYYIDIYNENLKLIYKN